MSVTIQEEDVTSQLLDELLPLLTAHNDELYYDLVPLHIDKDLYCTLAQQGTLRAFIARDGTTIKGYISYIVSPYINNPAYIMATQNGLFVTKDARNGTLGIKLIKHGDQVLKVDGVDLVSQFFNVHNNIGSILTRLGYSPSEQIYTRRL